MRLSLVTYKTLFLHSFLVILKELAVYLRHFVSEYAESSRALTALGKHLRGHNPFVFVLLVVLIELLQLVQNRARGILVWDPAHVQEASVLLCALADCRCERECIALAAHRLTSVTWRGDWALEYVGRWSIIVCLVEILVLWSRFTTTKERRNLFQKGLFSLICVDSLIVVYVFSLWCSLVRGERIIIFIFWWFLFCHLTIL